MRLTEASGPPPAPPATQQPAGPSQPLTPDEQAALEEIQRRRVEGAELICIIRSRTDPQARSEVLVLDKVSPGFLRQLTAEPPARPEPPPATAPRSLPLGQTVDQNSSLAAPASGWWPRWLENGYQGS